MLLCVSLSPTIFDEDKDGKDEAGHKIKMKKIPAVELDDLIHQATRVTEKARPDACAHKQAAFPTTFSRSLKKT
jgi:hypothetical protein